VRGNKILRIQEDSRQSSQTRKARDDLAGLRDARDSITLPRFVRLSFYRVVG